MSRIDFHSTFGTIRTQIVALLISFCSVASVAYGQVRFTSADNPTPGQSFGYSLVDAAGFDPGPAGTNVTWDFGSLVHGSGLSRTIITREQLPSAMQVAFPTASFAIVDDTTTYVYAPSGRTLRMIGIITRRTVTNLAEPNNPYETRPTEFTQNQVHTDQFSGTVNYPIGLGQAVATARTVFDGVGTLTLNVEGSPFRNVKRLVTRISRSDQFSGSPSNYLQQTVTTVHEWYPERGSLPLLELRIDTTRLFSNGRLVGPPTVAARLLMTQGFTATSVHEHTSSAPSHSIVVRAGHVLAEGSAEDAHQFIALHGAVVASIKGTPLVVPILPPGVYAVQSQSSTNVSRRMIIIAP
jgi:hypothetical protein